MGACVTPSPRGSLSPTPDETAALWFAIAVAVILVLPGRQANRLQSAAWLLAVLPVALMAEALVTLAYTRSTH